MRPHSYIAFALLCAIAAAALGIVASRQAHAATDPAYLLIGTSPNPEVNQTLTVIRYGSMRECLSAQHAMVIQDTSRMKVTVTVRPFCTEERPTFWVE